MLELRNIHKALGEFAISDVNLSVKKGDYCVLLGESGAGKSVILELIAGILAPDSGSIDLNNTDITQWSTQKRKIGLVYQDLCLFPHKTVYENIAFPLKIIKHSTDKIDEKVHKLAREMNFSHLLNQKPGILSGGEQQRIALARTLAMDPKIILLDEPMASLDVILRNDIGQLLRNINRAGKTIIHVTHNYEEALSLANKVAIVQDGTISQYGTPKEVFGNPTSTFIANLTNAKNFHKVELKTEGNKRFAYTQHNLNIQITSNLPDGPGYIMLRTTDIVLSKERLISSATNNFKGKIIDIRNVHGNLEIIIDCGNLFTAHITEDSLNSLNLHTEMEIWISFKATAVRSIRS